MEGDTSIQEMRVRQATAGDLDQLLDLNEAVAAEGIHIAAEAPIDRESKRATYQSMIDASDATILVAEVDGRIVGMGGINGTGVAELGMYVAAGSRRMGVGSALLEGAIAWARQKGAHKISLDVWPHNDAARSLYRKFGFVEEGYLRHHYRRRNGELWDAVLMGLPL
jgi:RimJ/RimL family protein N-acetyltransferase